jgi:hypothetical protein
VVEGFDHIDDFFDLVDELDDCFLGDRHFDGNAVDTRNSAFRSRKGIDIDSPARKNDGDSVENPNEIFSDDKDGITFHWQAINGV